MFDFKSALGLLLVLPLAAACSDDSKTTPNGGLDAGSGGSGGAGGKDGGSAGKQGDPYTETVCPGGITAPGVTKNFPSCDTVCGAPSHCLTVSLVMGQGSMLPDCPDDGAHRPGKCVPDEIAETVGQFVFKKCNFFLDNSEGRCVPRCIANQQNANASLLMQDVCGTEEVCAPCVDPTNGNATTHACDSYCKAVPEGGTSSDASTFRDSGGSSPDASQSPRDGGGTKPDASDGG